MENYDIIIVGGGIAGLSTALHASRKVKASILLIDKNVIGDPTRTSPFTFPDIVERFNLSDAVLQKYIRFKYMSPTGVTASFEYESPPLLTLDYPKLCNILLNRIRKEGNVIINEKTEARDFEVNSDLKLTLSTSRKVSCNVLVDTSGTAFFASRRLGVKLPALFSHPYGEFLEGCKIEDPNEMCIFTGRKFGNGGGWLYPINKKTARFGFATITRSPIYPKGIVEKNFRKAIQDFYPYNEMLVDAKSRWSEFGTIPIGPMKKLVHKQVLIVGDAAGQATPWYNEGIRPALESGKICGNTLAEAYERGKLRKKKLMRYQHFWDAKNRKVYSHSMLNVKLYSRTQERWDDSVRYYALLTPDEVIGIIRNCKFPKVRSEFCSRESYMHRIIKRLKETIYARAQRS